MFVRRLTVWFLVFVTSGLVGLSVPSEVYGECNSICIQREMKESIGRMVRQIKRGEVSQTSRKTPSEPSKIRIRGLSGSISSGTTTVSNTSTSLIWNSWGIGQSLLKYKNTKTTTSYDLSNTSTDLSYTFGDEWTLTLEPVMHFTKDRRWF